MLHPANVYAEPISFNFDNNADEFYDIAPDWRRVYPDPSVLSLSFLRDYVDDNGEAFSIDCPSEEDYLDSQGELRDYAYREELEAAFESIMNIKVDRLEPAANYLYPVKLFDRSEETAQAELMERCPEVMVVLARDADGDEQPYLTLGGSGMDMSWYVCKAYMTLGLMPPVYFADLPNVEGEARSHPEVVEACRETAQWLMGEANKLMDNLERLTIEPDAAPAA